jgi:hypothetical protein
MIIAMLLTMFTNWDFNTSTMSSLKAYEINVGHGK